MNSLTRDELRAIDRFAIETLGVPGVVLMENAGRCAADAIERMLGGVGAKSVAIVAGAGNNGGDGYVVARQLSIRGAEIVTFLVCPPEKIAGDALVNLRIIRNMGLDVRTLDAGGIGKLSVRLHRFALVVDAVGGTGVRGALRGDTATAVEQINAAGRPVVAIDIPTGLDCDTGTADGPVVRADTTVTFVASKRGFDSPDSRKWTGEVLVADIGINAEIVRRMMGR